MRKFIVIALSVGGLGNKIFNSGDVVSETDFAEGSVDRLVELGYLKADEETAKKVKDDKPNPTELTAEQQALFDSNTKASLMELFTAKNIEFDAKANKTDLFKVFLANGLDKAETSPSVEGAQ